MKISYLIRTVTLATTAFLASCNMLVYDDRSDCPTSADSLHFTYRADVGHDVFPKYINAVRLFCYDAAGLLVEQKQIDKQSLRRNQGATIDFGDGTYTIVAWGNSFADTKTMFPENPKKAYVTTPAALTQEAVRTNDPLYFATKELVCSSQVSEQYTMDFRSAHVKVRLLLVDPEKSRGIVLNAPKEPGFRMNRLAHSTDFAGRPSKEEITYEPIVKKTAEGDYEAAFNVLRFEDDNPITIDLIDRATNNRIVGTVILKDFLAKHKIKISGVNEAVVAIKFTCSATSITIEPWGAANVNPGFDN